MLQKVKPLILRRGYSVFIDSDGIEYLWENYRRTYTIACKIGVYQKNTKEIDGNPLMNSFSLNIKYIHSEQVIKTNIVGSKEFTKVSGVTLYFDDDFLYNYMENIYILQPSEDYRNKNPIFLYGDAEDLCKYQPMSERTILKFRELILKACPEKSIQLFRTISKNQKLSEEFIMENIHWLDVKYLKTSHLSSKFIKKLKMLRELI